MGKWATPHRFAKEFSRFVREAERSTLIIWSPSKKWHNNYIKSRLCSFPPNNDNHSTHIFVLIVIKKNTKDEKNNLYTRTTYRTYVQNTREIENNAELVFFFMWKFPCDEMWCWFYGNEFSAPKNRMAQILCSFSSCFSFPDQDRIKMK